IGGIKGQGKGFGLSTRPFSGSNVQSGEDCVPLFSWAGLTFYILKNNIQILLGSSVFSNSLGSHRKNLT
ncbi:hypothetical protein PJN17_29510, partial [Mycobacterium kansasii]